MANGKTKKDLGIETFPVKTVGDHEKQYAGTEKQVEELNEKYGQIKALSVSRVGDYLTGEDESLLPIYKAVLKTLKSKSEEWKELNNLIERIENKQAAFKASGGASIGSAVHRITELQDAGELDSYFKKQEEYKATYEKLMAEIDFTTQKNIKWEIANKIKDTQEKVDRLEEILKDPAYQTEEKKEYRANAEKSLSQAQKELEELKSKALEQQKKLNDLTAYDNTKSIVLKLKNDIENTQKILNQTLESPEYKAGNKKSIETANRAREYLEKLKAEEKKQMEALSKFKEAKTEALRNAALKTYREYDPVVDFLNSDKAKGDPALKGVYAPKYIPSGMSTSEGIAATKKMASQMAAKHREKYKNVLKPGGTVHAEQEHGITFVTEDGVRVQIAGVDDRYYEGELNTSPEHVGPAPRGKLVDIKTGGIYRGYGAQLNLYALMRMIETGEMPSEAEIFNTTKSGISQTHSVKLADPETIKNMGEDVYKLMLAVEDYNKKVADGIATQDDAIVVYEQIQNLLKKRYLDKMSVETKVTTADIPLTKDGKRVYKDQLIDENGNYVYQDGKPVFKGQKKGEDGKYIYDDETNKKIDQYETWKNTRFNNRTLQTIIDEKTGRARVPFDWTEDDMKAAIMGLPDDEREEFIAQQLFGTKDFNEKTGQFEERESGYHLGDGVSKKHKKFWDNLRQWAIDEGIVQNLTYARYVSPDQFDYEAEEKAGIEFGASINDPRRIRVGKKAAQGRFFFDSSQYHNLTSGWNELGHGQELGKQVAETFEDQIKEDKERYQANVEEVEKKYAESEAGAAQLKHDVSDTSLDPTSIASRLIRVIDAFDRVDVVMKNVYESDAFKEATGLTDTSEQERRAMTRAYLANNNPEMWKEYTISEDLSTRFNEKFGDILSQTKDTYDDDGQIIKGRELTNEERSEMLSWILGEVRNIAYTGEASQEIINLQKAIEGFSKINQNWEKAILEGAGDITVEDRQGNFVKTVTDPGFDPTRVGNRSQYRFLKTREKLLAGQGFAALIDQGADEGYQYATEEDKIAWLAGRKLAAGMNIIESAPVRESVQMAKDARLFEAKKPDETAEKIFYDLLHNKLEGLGAPEATIQAIIEQYKQPLAEGESEADRLNSIVDNLQIDTKTWTYTFPGIPELEKSGWKQEKIGRMLSDVEDLLRYPVLIGRMRDRAKDEAKGAESIRADDTSLPEERQKYAKGVESIGPIMFVQDQQAKAKKARRENKDKIRALSHREKRTDSLGFPISLKGTFRRASKDAASNIQEQKEEVQKEEQQTAVKEEEMVAEEKEAIAEENKVLDEEKKALNEKREEVAKRKKRVTKRKAATTKKKQSTPSLPSTPTLSFDTPIDVHATSTTPYDIQGQTLRSVLLDDKGNLIGQTYAPAKRPPVSVDWGAGGLPQFIKDSAELSDKDFKDAATKIISGTEGFHRASGVLNKRGQNELEAVLEQAGRGQSHKTQDYLASIDGNVNTLVNTQLTEVIDYLNDINANIQNGGGGSGGGGSGGASQVDAEKQAFKEFADLAKEETDLVVKLDAIKKKYGLATTDVERKSLEELAATYGNRLTEISGKKQQAETIARGYNSTRVDEIIKELAYREQVGKAQNATRDRGARTIWDVMNRNVKMTFQRFFDFRLINQSLAKLQQRLRQTVTIVQELDKAATNIRIVSGMNAKEVDNLMSSYNSLAKELGTTTKAIAESSNVWLRQGYDINATNKLIRSSTYLSKLGMLDMNSATKVLTSTLKGFKMEASESMSIVDKLTKLDTKFAASAGEIGEAISRTASLAQQANVSLDETAAIVTTIMDVTQQSAEMAGTALRTILSRYGNVKAGAFINIDEEDAENINDIEKVLGRVGIQIRSGTSDMRAFDDVLDDLNEKWVALTDVEKNAIATAVAGVRQRNAFITLMSNYSRYQEAVKTAQESEGTSLKKMEAYMDSIEYYRQQQEAAWEKFSQTVLDSDVFKVLIRGSTWLIENLPQLISLFTQWFAVLNAYKVPAWFSPITDFFGRQKEGDRDGVPRLGIRERLRNRRERSVEEFEEKSSQYTADWKEGKAGLKTQLSNIITGLKTLGTTGERLDATIQKATGQAVIQERLDTENQTLTIKDQAYKLQELHVDEEGNVLTADNNRLSIQDNTIKENLVQELSKNTSQLQANNAGGGEKGTSDNPLAPKGKGSKWKMAGSAALMAGVSSAITGAMQGNETWTDRLIGGGLSNKTQSKVSDLAATAADRAITGAASGAGAALGAALGSFGGPLGTMLGTTLGAKLGEGIATLIKHDIHLAELQRKDRVDAALKVVEAIDKTNESLSNISNKISSMSEWDESDRSEMREYILKFEQSLLADETGSLAQNLVKALNNAGFEGSLSDSLEKMASGTEEQAKKVYNLTQAVLYRRKAQETLSSQEEDRYSAANEVGDELRLKLLRSGYSELQKIASKEIDIRGALEKRLQTLLKDTEKLTDKQRKEIEVINSSITTIDNAWLSIKGLNAEVNKLAVQGAFRGSSVAEWSAGDIATKSLEEAIFTITQQLIKDNSLYGQSARTIGGVVDREIRDYITTALKDAGGYERLFRNDTHMLVRLMQTSNKQQELADKTSYTFEELVNYLNTYGVESSQKAIKRAADMAGISEDALRSMIFEYNAMTEETKNFARVLNVLPEDLKNFTELSRVTLADLSKTVTELTEDMDNLVGVVNNIVSTGSLSIKNLSNIINTMPELLAVYEEDEKGGKVAAGLDMSAQNIMRNIFGMFYSGQYNTLLSQSALEQLLGSEKIMSLFKESMGNPRYLEPYSTLTDAALAEIRQNEDMNSLVEFLSNNAPTYMEAYQELLKQVAEYESHMIEGIVDNLQSQKDALGAVNEEYKKQIDLIKARQALENAQNERKRVYRAGVGWTYETDQTAVAEARDALADKERELEEENIQYQIDAFNKIKDIFEHIPNNESLKEQKIAFEEFGTAIGSNIETLSGFSFAITEAYNKTLGLGDAFDKTIRRLTVDKSVEAAVRELLEEDVFGETSAYSKTVNARNTMNNSGSTHTEDYFKAAQTYSTNLADAQNMFEGAKVSEWKSHGIVDESGNVNVSAFNAAYGTDYGSNDQKGLQSIYDKYKTISEYGKISVPEYPSYEANGAIVYFDKKNKLYYTPSAITKNFKNKEGHQYFLSWDGKRSLGATAKNYEAGKIPEDTAKAMTNLIMYAKRGVGVRQGDLIRFGNGLFVAVDNIGSNSMSWMQVGIPTGNDKSMQKDFKESFKAFRDAYGVESAYDTYASGTYSTLFPHSALINELGTEGIVTPRGTITALPSHTGIVPADLTRNLYTLGELAPSMIKTFSLGQDVISQRSQTSEDNSMNINNLYATFETDDGFDFERLLVQARQYVATTKNNKH